MALRQSIINKEFSERLFYSVLTPMNSFFRQIDRIQGLIVYTTSSERVSHKKSSIVQRQRAFRWILRVS